MNGRHKPPKAQVYKLDQRQFSELVQIINNLSANIGKWLAAIALAAANPADNTVEVKKLTEELRAEADALEAARDTASQDQQPADKETEDNG